jgi:predicted Zn-dependent peptidase
MNKITDSLTGEVIYTKKHESGLNIYIMPRKGYKKGYAVFATKYGSIDSEFIVPGDSEPTSVPDGIAHYLEHKMFDMPNDINIFSRFSQYGADANAFTSFNTTAYLFSATSNFEASLATLLEYVQTPYFTEESVRKEQGIIGQEIKMYEDNAGWAVFFNLLNCLYKNHPVKREIAGTVESIAKIDSELLYKCYNTFYNLSNMMIFVTGDFVPEEILAVIENGIKNNKPFDSEIKRIYPNEPEEIAAPYCEKRLSVSQPQFMLGFKDNDVGFGGKRLLKKYMLTDILISMITSESTPLYARLLEEGLINDTFGGEYTMHESYGYTTFEGESPEPERVRDMILDEIARLGRDGLDEEEFNRVKKAMWGDYIRSYDNLTGFAHTFMSLEMMGINYMSDYYEVYKSISFDDVKKRFEEHFDPKYCALSVIKPIV